MPSMSTYSVASVPTATNVVRTATFNGKLADAYDTSYKATAKLTKGEAEFPISDASLPTRSDKFFGTASTFAKGGASVGATIANAITLPYDFLAGQGREAGDSFENAATASDAGAQSAGKSKGAAVITPSEAPEASLRAASSGNILNKGLLGHGVDAVTTGGGLVTEMAGAFTGATVAVVGSPASSMSSKGIGAWVRSGAQQGGNVSSTIATTLIGTPLGLALDVIRAPSVAAKYGTALIFAIPSAVVGTVAGGVRSLINK